MPKRGGGAAGVGQPAKKMRLATFQRNSNKTDHAKIKKLWKAAEKPQKKMVTFTESSGVDVYEANPWCPIQFPASQGGTEGNRRDGNTVWWQGGVVSGEIHWRSSGVTNSLLANTGIRVIIGMRKKGPDAGYTSSSQRGQAIMNDLFGGYTGIAMWSLMKTNIDPDTNNERANYVVLKDKVFMPKDMTEMGMVQEDDTDWYFRTGYRTLFKIPWTLKNNEGAFQGAVAPERLPYKGEPFVLFFSNAADGVAIGGAQLIQVRCEMRQVWTEEKVV